MATRPTPPLSDKEKALLEAARAEIARLKAQGRAPDAPPPAPGAQAVKTPSPTSTPVPAATKPHASAAAAARPAPATPPATPRLAASPGKPVLASSRAPLSDKEKALIAAARDEVAKRTQGAVPGAATLVRPTGPQIPPAPQTEGASQPAATPRPTAGAAPLSVVSKATPASQATPAAPAPVASEALQRRLAALMEDERVEKLRRKQAYLRWNIGLGVFLGILGLWFVMWALGQMKH